MPRILIVEDEPDMARGLQFNLEARGYDVVLACDGEQGYRSAIADHPDLVLLDVMLPKRDGLDVCRAIRKAEPKLPVVILTARGREDDVVLGLKLGADDYIKKPFSVAELVARIETVLRRTAGAGGRPCRLEFDNVVIDFERHDAQRGDRPIDLTPKEFEMLRYLVAHTGRPVTHRELLQAVWGPDYGDEPEYLRVFINQLRKKIEINPGKPKYILTEPWVGYRFAG